MPVLLRWGCTLFFLLPVLQLQLVVLAFQPLPLLLLEVVGSLGSLKLASAGALTLSVPFLLVELQTDVRYGLVALV